MGRGGSRYRPCLGYSDELMEMMMDNVTGHLAPPVVKDGFLNLKGNQIIVTNHLKILTENPNYFYCQPGQMMADPLNPLNQPGHPSTPIQMPIMPMQVVPPAQVAPAVNLPLGQLVGIRINVAGSKTESKNYFCYILTIFFAMILIFPMFFFFCKWWKRIVNPKYVVNPQFYVSLGNFLRNTPECRTLDLTIGDSAFDREKAQLLCQSLNGSRVKILFFHNSTSPTNYKSSEFDDFQTNVQPIKALPIGSTFSWGKMKF